MADRVDLNIDGTNYSIPEFAYDRSIQDLIKAVNQLASRNQTGFKKIDTQAKTLESILKVLQNEAKNNANKKTDVKVSIDTTAIEQELQNLVAQNKDLVDEAKSDSSVIKSAISQLIQDNKKIVDSINLSDPEAYKTAIGSSFDDLASKLQQSINQQSINQQFTQAQQTESVDTPQVTAGSVAGFENAQIVQMLTRIADATERTADNLEKKSKPQASSSTDKNTDELKAVKNALDDSTKANKGMIGKMLDTLGGRGGVLGGVIGGFAKFGRLLNPATAAIAGLISGLKAAFKFLMRLGRLENTIFRRGFNEIADTTGPNAGVADGIATFAARAADASLSLDQFIELSGEFATVMGEYGTKTVTDAIQNTQGLLREQGYLGLSNQELSQATVETAEAMRILGFDLEGNNKQISDNTVRVLRTTQAFTRLTNTSNDVIRQMVIQASAIESFTNALQMLPTDLRQNALASSQTAFAGLAAFGSDLGGELTTALSEGIGRGGLQFTQFGQDLARVSPALLQSLQNLSYEAGSGGNVVGALDDFRSTIGTVDQNSRQFLRALEISGDPMAKFVIRLANLNETVDDNTFAEMVKTMSEIDAGQLGRAQNQMALALAKIRTAFTKVALAFLNEDTVNGFQFMVDKFTDALGGVADWLKGPGFKMINDAFTGVTNFIADLFGGKMTLWEGLTRAFSGVFSGLGDILTQGISSGIRRGVAIAIPGGVNSDMIDRMDNLARAYREAAPENKDTKLNELYDYVFNTQTLPSGIEVVNPFSKSGAEMTTPEERQQMLEALRNYEFGVNLGSTAGTTTATTETAIPGAQQTDGAVRPDSNIKIMPMFGNPDDYTDREQSPEEKTNKLLEDILIALQDGNITAAESKSIQQNLKTIQENNQIMANANST